MSTRFDLSTYIYSNLLNNKNVPRQIAAAKFCRGSLDPISRAECVKIIFVIIESVSVSKNPLLRRPPQKTTHIF